ncbi:MAG TPA: tetratricopeptide repeat protein [Verrucomicrobiae bacterium]|nr:tetratricopeptide repeat protein [Verrucomicrobiae bacterium]
MAIRNQTDPRKNFAPKILPWLLAVAVFVIYALTLNHWVSLFNYLAVAKISGWMWQPEIYNPLFFTVTAPFRWLPAAQIPIALNLFSALCAAVTLGLLARSVAILPQDRTDAQREREHSAFSFLTMKSAWLPPVFAVLICGLQMTFWEQATNCTTEMFDLLLFAFVIWLLLEYRLDERTGRLYLAALVYGAGMAENWAMAGFLPVFIGAIIWIRGLSFFNLRFLRRMILCGLAGMLFYLLMPLLAAVSHKVELTFWQTLKLGLLSQWTVIKAFFTVSSVRRTVLLLSPTSLVPMLVMAIRWKSSFGDNSKLGLALTSLMFHIFHALILMVCVWVAFDPPIGARHEGQGLPFLTFNYLGALGIGYFIGYFLLIFGKPAEDGSRRSKSRSQEIRKVPLGALNRVIVAAVWLFAASVVTGLVYKNVPQIRDTNGDILKQYAKFAADNLPRAGGIVLSDDPRRLIFVQAALTQSGRAKDFLMVDTQFLPAPTYHSFLHESSPQQWPDTVGASEKTNGISPLHNISLLATLAKTNDIYYLHPSFGYYFEQFYPEPHGVVYKLNTLPQATLLPPALDKSLIAANENFWAQADKTAFTPLIAAASQNNSAASKSFGEKLLACFHVPREPNPNAAIAGPYYSRCLNFWGVRNQRAGDLTNAAAHFEMAQQLNPDNIVAQVNLEFNRSLQAGESVQLDLAKVNVEKYSSWNALLNENGPFDEPSFCFRTGVIFASQNRLFRQAVEPFERVRQLVPDNLTARLWLAQCYLVSGLPDRALDAIREPLDQPQTFSLTPTNSAQLNILAAAAYFQKNDNVRGVQIMETEIARHPTNTDLLMTAAQVYLKRGLFTNALTIIDRRLLAAPDDPTWLFAKGFTSIQMKNYHDAIVAFTQLLALQSNNPDALFNRAIANLNSDHLDDARTDFLQLQQTYTNSFQISYGLGEIAWRKHETNEAVKNYQAYLANANTNTAEATNIIQRLQDLQGQPH